MPHSRRDSPASSSSSSSLPRDIWALTALAIAIVILRIVAKLRIGKFGPDDLLMVFALCLATVGSIMLTLGVNHGFGQGMSEISAPVSQVIMYDYLAQSFALAGGAVGRVSFIVFLSGLLGSRLAYRIVLWILIGLQGIVNSVFIVIMFVQCPGHASAIWEHPGKAKCWDARVQAYYGYFQGALNAATDLYLAVFSTCIFWSLNLKSRVKLGLIGLLGLGVFAMIAAIVKTAQTRVLAMPHDDPTTATVDYDRWLFIETYLVIITTSIPCIRSLVRSLRGRPVISRDMHQPGSQYVVSSAETPRMRRCHGSSDGKILINVSKDNVGNDEIPRGNDYEMHESGCSTESVRDCV